MKVDTVFGNTVEMELGAELDNPHELVSRTLFTDMARLLRIMVEEIRSENERHLAERQSD